MEYLKLFHRDLLTIRSHQWKYYVEPYTGCPLQCTYCLYWESPAFVKQLCPPEGLLQGLERDLGAMTRKQIVYIGATIDPYQMLEKKAQSTRQILERLLVRDLPVVILTKSPLILRDLDLLLEFKRRGLVLLQFTVLTIDETKARLIERGAPTVADRLSAASELTAAGIPVHFHLSPVISGLYEQGELNATVASIAKSGGQCIYSNILGMRRKNKRIWFDSIEKLPPAVGERSRSAYTPTGATRKNVYSPDVTLIYSEMSELQKICCDNHIDFICEFIPALDLFDSTRFDRGVFRFGLPTVYQMARLFKAVGGHMSWPCFRECLKHDFQAVDDDYLGLVQTFWDDGQLFHNTTIGSELVDGKRVYFQTGRLQLAKDSILAWD
jgi:DNA repair photolyase